MDESIWQHCARTDGTAWNEQEQYFVTKFAQSDAIWIKKRRPKNNSIIKNVRNKSCACIWSILTRDLNTYICVSTYKYIFIFIFTIGHWISHECVLFSIPPGLQAFPSFAGFHLRGLGVSQQHHNTTYVGQKLSNFIPFNTNNNNNNNTKNINKKGELKSHGVMSRPFEPKQALFR